MNISIAITLYQNAPQCGTFGRLSQRSRFMLSEWGMQCCPYLKAEILDLVLMTGRAPRGLSRARRAELPSGTRLSCLRTSVAAPVRFTSWHLKRQRHYRNIRRLDPPLGLFARVVTFDHFGRTRSNRSRLSTFHS
jgi:hypothetical protein